MYPYFIIKFVSGFLSLRMSRVWLFQVGQRAFCRYRAVAFTLSKTVQR